MPAFKDLTGKRFGNLEVISLEEKKFNGKRYRYYWCCQCDCGNTCVVRGDSLSKGGTRSCGCLHKKAAIKNVSKHHRHKMSGTPAYHVWQSMKRRCHNPSDKSFPRYGGRGIKVCDEWRNDFQTFYDYVNKLEHFGEAGYTLDRTNNDGDYEPGNVCWSDAKTQARNRRSNVIVEYHGERMTVTEAAKKSGIHPSCLFERVGCNRKGRDIFRPSGQNAKYVVEANGKAYTFKEIAAIAGLSLGAIYKRYEAGKRGEELFKSSQRRGNQSDCERLTGTVEHRS